MEAGTCTGTTGGYIDRGYEPKPVVERHDVTPAELEAFMHNVRTGTGDFDQSAIERLYGQVRSVADAAIQFSDSPAEYGEITNG